MSRVLVARLVAAAVVAVTALATTPLQAQVSLSWPMPPERPGAAAFGSGDFASAAAAIRHALAGPVAGPDSVLDLQVDLARSLYGAGEVQAAQALAEQVADLARARGAPDAEAAAALVAGDIGFGLTAQRQAEWFDRAEARARAIGDDGGLKAALDLRIPLARALAQARGSAALAVSTLEALERQAPVARLGPDDRAWRWLVTARVLGQAGRSREALPLADAAAQSFRELQAAGHPIQLYTGLQQALLSRRLGDYAGVRRRADELLSVARQSLPAHHPWTLEVMAIQAREAQRAEDSPRALALARAVAEGAAVRYGESSVQHLSARTSIAEVQIGAGDAGQAAQALVPIVQLLGQQAPAGPAHRDALHVLATAFSKAGEVAKALRIWQELLAVELPVKGEHDDGVWATMNNIAAMYRDQGDDARALAEYQRLEGLMKGRVGRSQGGLVSVMNNRAEVLIRMRKFQDAIPLLQDLVTVLQQDRQPLDVQLMRARSNLASAYGGLGQHEQALQLHERTLADRQRGLPAGHPDILNSQAQVAYAMDLLGRHEQAAERYLDVYRLRKQRFGLSHPSTIVSARQAAGILANPLRRFEASRAIYAEAVRGIETLRDAAGLTEEVRQRYFSEFAQVYKNHARVLARLQRWEDAFDTIDLSKARTLVERTQATAASQGAAMAEPDRRALAAAERRASIATNRLALAPPASLEGLRAAELERDRAFEALQGLRGSLAHRYGWQTPFSGTLPAPRALAASDLEKGEVFVSFSLLGNALMAVAMDGQGRVEGRLLEDQPGLVDALLALQQISAHRGGLPEVMIGSDRSPPRLLWRLADGGYRLLPVDQRAPAGARPEASEQGLVEHVSDTLGRAVPNFAWAAKRLIVSPDEQIAVVPLDRLERAGLPWIADREIVLAQSWTLHVLLKSRARGYAALRRADLLMIGDPSYSGGTAPQGTLRSGTVGPAPERAAPTALPDLAWYRLPGSAAEVSSLAPLFALTPSISLFTGDQATESTVRRLSDAGDLSRFRMIHLAAHGYVHPRIGQLSSVVLAEAQPGAARLPDADGYLTAGEWLGLRMKSDLVFIAACDSASGQQVSGEGILGLPFGLFGAGNRSTVLTLWSVYDQATAEFSRRFYEKVRAGDRFSTALARTKREFWRGEAGEAWRAPAFWAPFVLYGG